MGRPKLELACSVCKRSPEEVRILSNRYCVDCMSEYNRNARHARLRASSTVAEEMIFSPDEDYIWYDGHWDEYNKDFHGPKRNVVHKDFDEMH